MHTRSAGDPQWGRTHSEGVLISCNAIMLARSELIYLNMLCMFCALTCVGIETVVKTRAKQLTRRSRKESAIVEFVFIVWTCLYIAVLLCVLSQLVFQKQSPDTKYLCSWFCILQIAFYVSFLLSYVGCLDFVSKIICEMCFPTINAISWIVLLVCLAEGQGVAEFRDSQYFTVHILPTVAASFHEVYIFNFCGFSSSEIRSRLRTVWTMYSPALLLNSYALSYDETEVYNYNIKPPNPLFVTLISIFSNIRYVYFPYQYGWRNFSSLYYIKVPTSRSNQMTSCKISGFIFLQAF